MRLLFGYVNSRSSQRWEISTWGLVKVSSSVILSLIGVRSMKRRRTNVWLVEYGTRTTCRLCLLETSVTFSWNERWDLLYTFTTHSPPLPLYRWDWLSTFITLRVRFAVSLYQYHSTGETGFPPLSLYGWDLLSLFTSIILQVRLAFHLYHFTGEICFEGVSNIITLLHYPVFCFSGTSLLGKLGQICFSEFLKTISSFFAQNFCTDRVDVLLCSEKKKTGGFSSKFGTLAPRSIVGVSDKHVHDSDHAECLSLPVSFYRWDWLSTFITLRVRFAVSVYQYHTTGETGFPPHVVYNSWKSWKLLEFCKSSWKKNYWWTDSLMVLLFTQPRMCICFTDVFFFVFFPSTTKYETTVLWNGWTDYHETFTKR